MIMQPTALGQFKRYFKVCLLFLANIPSDSDDLLKIAQPNVLQVHTID